jgi:hypothetical protein
MHVYFILNKILNDNQRYMFIYNSLYNLHWSRTHSMFRWAKTPHCWRSSPCVWGQKLLVDPWVLWKCCNWQSSSASFGFPSEKLFNLVASCRIMVLNLLWRRYVSGLKDLLMIGKPFLACWQQMSCLLSKNKIYQSNWRESSAELSLLKTRLFEMNLTKLKQLRKQQLKHLSITWSSLLARPQPDWSVRPESVSPKQTQEATSAASSRSNIQGIGEAAIDMQLVNEVEQELEEKM